MRERRYAPLGVTTDHEARIASLEGAGGGTAWGSITGTLSNQTDLQSALDAKAASSHTHVEADITDLGAYLENLVEDTTPQLGGTLDAQSNNITTVASLTMDSVLTVQDPTNTDSLTLSCTTSDGKIASTQHVWLSPAAGHSIYGYTGGQTVTLGVYDGTGADSLFMSHDGTDANIACASTTDLNFTGVTGVYKFDQPLTIGEQSAASADAAGFGQIWVKNDSPNHLFFTDDGGADYAIGYAEYKLFANQSDTVDAGYINAAWYSDNATAYTLTLQASSLTTFPVGGQFTIWNEGSGTLTINEGTGDTLYLLDGSAVTDTAGGCTMAQGGYATVIRKSTTVWLIMGAGLTA